MPTIRKRNTQRDIDRRAQGYDSFKQMRRRCNDPTNIGFSNYGGRGIKVCERWSTFSAFIEDMGPRPPGMTLERIDPNGHYEPANCRWASRIEQSRNTRRNIWVEFRGQRMCLKDACQLAGLDKGTVRHRIVNMGWSPERALSEPPRKGGPHAHRNA